MKLVYVVWEDAADLDEGPWVEREGRPPDSAVDHHFHQVGYLFELTNEAVTLTSCVGKDHMAPRSRIPAGMVRSMVELVEGAPVKIPRKPRIKRAP